MKKKVNIDGTEIVLDDPMDCPFNYDCVGCHYPKVRVACPDWHAPDEGWPEGCPLKEATL